MLEVDMVNEGYEYLLELNQYKLITREVPFLSRCIDIALVTKEEKIITIEFKISKWREAIEQAKNHKLGADISYICLPSRRITPVLEEAIKSSGIGLLFFDHNSDQKISEIFKPSDSFAHIDVFHKLLISNIEKTSL